MLFSSLSLPERAEEGGASWLVHRVQHIHTYIMPRLTHRAPGDGERPRRVRSTRSAREMPRLPAMRPAMPRLMSSLARMERKRHMRLPSSGGGRAGRVGRGVSPAVFPPVPFTYIQTCPQRLTHRTWMARSREIKCWPCSW